MKGVDTNIAKAGCTETVSFDKKLKGVGLFQVLS